MKTHLDFFFDEDKGITTCTYRTENREFIGKAYCHPDDFDFKAKITGESISERRAKIKYLKHELNCNLRPGLAALKQLYFSVDRSKFYNKTDYLAKALTRQIKIKESEIELLKDIIKDKEDSLKNYIDEKEKLYQRLRKMRDKEN